MNFRIVAVRITTASSGPIVLAYFTPHRRLTMRMIGLTRVNQIIPNITSTTVYPEEVVPNAHFNGSAPESSRGFNSFCKSYPRRGSGFIAVT